MLTEVWTTKDAKFKINLLRRDGLLVVIAAVTNNHRLNGLQQNSIIILLQFWRPEIQNWFYWAKVKV